MPLDVLVISPMVMKHQSPHSTADGCTFDAATNFTVKVSTDDGSGTLTALTVTPAADGHSARASLPAAPRPLRVVVTVTPTGANADRFWEVSGDIQYQGNAVWGSLATTPVQFQPAPSSFLQGASVTTFLNVWLPRVKDVTDRVLQELSTIPTNRTRWLPTALSTWKIPPAATRFVSSPPVDAGAIKVDAASTVDPDTTDLVFHIKGFKTPQLIAMCWPNAFGFPMGTASAATGGGGAAPTFLQAAPAPFLIFFHAQHGQNMPSFYTNGSPWPFGWDLLFFGLYHYLIYSGDVIQSWGSLGLPIQARHANKNCVVIVPQNKFGSHGPADEIIEFNDPDLVQEILEEIQVHMYFRAGKKFTRPSIGRTAAGSMSNGNVLLTQFLNTKAGKPFLNNILREVYVFDPNGSDDALNAAPVDAALSWAKTGPSDKMIRYFAQKAHPVHTRLLGAAPPTGDFVKDGTNANFTGGVISSTAWLAVGALDSNGQAQADWQVAHQLIPGMFLSYAFSKSGF
jgi:hypothetical protein